MPRPGRATSPKLIPVIVDELQKAGESIAQEELNRARAQYRAGLIMSAESASSRASQIARQLLLFGRPIAKEELMERLSALTVERLTRPVVAPVLDHADHRRGRAGRHARALRGDPRRASRSRDAPAPTRGLITDRRHVRASFLPPRSSGAERRARDAAAAGRRRLPRMGDASRRKPRLPRAVGAALGAGRTRTQRPGASGCGATARISPAARPSPSSSSRRSRASCSAASRSATSATASPRPAISATGSASAMPARASWSTRSDCLRGYAFDTLRLHRIEAACIPDNTAVDPRA